MGKKPDQIESEIRQRREEVGRRIDALQARVQDRMSATGQDARSRVSGAVDEAKGAFKPNGMMQEHPLSTMASALGLGVVLGVASSGFSTGNGTAYTPRAHESHENGRTMAGLGSLLAYIAGPAASTAQDEFQQLVRDGFESLREQVGRSAPEPQQRHEQVPTH